MILRSKIIFYFKREKTEKKGSQRVRKSKRVHTDERDVHIKETEMICNIKATKIAR